MLLLVFAYWLLCACGCVLAVTSWYHAWLGHVLSTFTQLCSSGTWCLGHCLYTEQE